MGLLRAFNPVVTLLPAFYAGSQIILLSLTKLSVPGVFRSGSWDCRHPLILQFSETHVGHSDLGQPITMSLTNNVPIRGKEEESGWVSVREAFNLGKVLPAGVPLVMLFY